MIALWASYQFRLATPIYERQCRVEGRAGNHIITFAKGKIITLAKQAHNSKLFYAITLNSFTRPIYFSLLLWYNLTNR